MRVDIAVYRARIGSFNCGAIKKTCTSDNRCSVIFVILLLSIISILLVIGGVELNPGPPKKQPGNDLRAEMDSLKEDMDYIKAENVKLRKRVDFLENQHKQQNIVIHGVTESESDLKEDIITNIKDKLNITVNKEDIEFVKRLGKPLRTQNQEQQEDSGVKQRPVLCRFVTSNLKGKIMTKVQDIVKNTRNIKTKFGAVKFMMDLPERVREMRRKLIPHMIQLRNEHSQDRTYKCYLKYDKLYANGTLYRLNVDDDSLVPVDG